MIERKITLSCFEIHGINLGEKGADQMGTGEPVVFIQKLHKTNYF